MNITQQTRDRIDLLLFAITVPFTIFAGLMAAIFVGLVVDHHVANLAPFREVTVVPTWRHTAAGGLFVIYFVAGLWSSIKDYHRLFV